MKKRDNLWRLIAIACLFLTFVTVFIGRLLYLQVSGQDYYTTSQPISTRTRTVPIQAQRGEIYDRNGVPLVVNLYQYSIALDYQSVPRDPAELNDMILDLCTIARRVGESDAVVIPRSSLSVEITGDGLHFSLPDGFLDTARGRRYQKLISELNVPENASPDEAGRALLIHFGILRRETDAETGKTSISCPYSWETAAELFAIRMDMHLSGFSSVEPYTLLTDVSLSVITGVEERYPRGFQVTASAKRLYRYPGYASHILGRVNKIPSNMVEYFTERGYPLNAMVGVDGVEFAFEEYLRGVDGVLTVTEDAYGNILSTEITKAPVAGRDVYLTIDIEMQMVAEVALAENIARIRQMANPDKPLTGEDAEKGALTVLDVDTGEVLAICSYPTYNLATFSQDYSALLADKNEPMFNRALSGTYAPGSTFKVGVSVAALSEGIITEDTVIDAQGEYLYYAASGFTPRCWLYLSSGKVHGEIGVVEAIQESCNYFFYEVGRNLTIEKMNEYCRHFGLGQPTGIELPERAGILAGPDYRNDNGLDKWSPGDTVQAAIGQSDNQFSPLQISSYLATILNSGTRYNAHLLYQVRNYEGKIEYQNTPRKADVIPISDKILSIVKEGMKGVMDNGSAASVFAGYEIPVGGKTGTAQVSEKKSDNGIMTAFAPFDDPEIVITCVIEQGYGGTSAGYAVRDVFDYYFKVDEIRAAAAQAAQNSQEGNDR